MVKQALWWGCDNVKYDGEGVWVNDLDTDIDAFDTVVDAFELQRVQGISGSSYGWSFILFFFL